MNKGRRSNQIALISAILCVGLVHAGMFAGLVATGNNSSVLMMQEDGASALTMHQFALQGIEEMTEGNATDSAIESEEIPDHQEPIVEEAPLEPEVTPEPQPVPEPPKEVEPEVLEPVVEKVPEPIEPEPVVEKTPEPVKEEIVTTKAPSEHKVAAKRPEKPVERRHQERKPPQKPRHQPRKAAESNRAVQTAKAVYSESEVSVLSKPVPGYPRAARQRRMQGTVDVIVSVNAQGAANSVRVSRSSGHDILDKAAIKAAQGIRLKPYLINGVATPINVNIQYVFKM